MMAKRMLLNVVALSLAAVALVSSPGEPLEECIESFSLLRKTPIGMTRRMPPPEMICALCIPASGRPCENAVPLSIVKTVAQKRAEAMWGPSTRLGSIVPMCDVKGRTTAYLLDFTLDGRPFPSYQEVAVEVAAERARRRATAWRRPADRSAMRQMRGYTRPEGLYAHIVVSARWDRVPVLEMAKGPSPFYSWGWVASSKALSTPGVGWHRRKPAGARL